MPDMRIEESALSVGRFSPIFMEGIAGSDAPVAPSDADAPETVRLPDAPLDKALCATRVTSEAWAAEACRDAGLDRCGSCGRTTRSRDDHLPRCPALGEA